MKILLAGSLILTSALIAGDASQYEIIGFSADGRFVAFERYGIQDGSAFPYSEIFIVDVERNAYAVSPVMKEVEENVDVDAARQVARQVASDLLARFGILLRNSGTLAWHNEASIPIREAVVEDRGAPVWIILTESEVEMDCTGGRAKIFTMELEFDDGASRMLQRDTDLPKSRNCAYAYRLESVHTYLDYLAVIVAYASDGYEGPNTRQLIVTGKYR